MDNDAFRETYRAVNERFCAYEKAILTNQCACSQAHKFCIAEREGVHCGSDQARADCLELLDILRRQARFTLKHTNTSDRTALPHAKAMRIQVGGLRGIQAVLRPDAPVAGPITDIRGIIRAALARFGSLDRFPFPEIIKYIAAYQGRRRADQTRK